MAALVKERIKTKSVETQLELATPLFGAEALLAWYDSERRDLPWRMKGGKRADPYKVWLSEVMLQQTVVKAAIPFYEKFVKRWPTVKRLARANREDVLAAWAGLGYYSRARNMHKCAQVVANELQGKFPRTEDELQKLPGIGPYTAAAIAAIAYDMPATVVDGNVERVVSRLFAVVEPLPPAKPQLKKLAARLTPLKRAGDYAQAMMDLGATVCTPKRPSCMMCPLKGECAARAKGIEATLPKRLRRTAKPLRRGIAFVTLREDGKLLLRQRPERGLLAAMMEVPSTQWNERFEDEGEALRLAPVRADWWPVPKVVSHVFTHFKLELQVYRAVVPVETTLNIWADGARCRWVNKRDLDAEALPSLMRKVIAHAVKEAD